MSDVVVKNHAAFIWSVADLLRGDNSQRNRAGHTAIFDTVSELLLATQMLVPSNATPYGPMRPVTVAAAPTWPLG